MNILKRLFFGNVKRNNIKNKIERKKVEFNFEYQSQTNRPLIKYMEKKVYGMKPSYKVMKKLLKDYNITGFSNHASNLVYYCIKHDFNEEQVKEYLNEQVNKCEKYLNHHVNGPYFEIEYTYMKDALNIDMNVFKLQKSINYSYNYDFENHLWNYNIDNVIEYNMYNTNYSSVFPEKMFRDYNDHTVYLYNECTTKNLSHYKGIISFKKYYDINSNIDKVKVIFYNNISPAGNNQYSLQRIKKEFVEGCLGLWHFMKMLDCIEHPNDIDVDNEVYKRLEVSEVFDNREREKIIYDEELQLIQKLNKDKNK